MQNGTMEYGYLELRDKTFMMLGGMDDSLQQEYALSIRNYLGNDIGYTEMVGYLKSFNNGDELVEFMNDNVHDSDVVNYDDQLHPSLLKMRNALDDLSIGGEEDQLKASRLTFYLLADMKDEHGWFMADARREHSNKLNNNAGRNQQKEGDGPHHNHSDNDFELM